MTSPAKSRENSKFRIWNKSENTTMLSTSTNTSTTTTTEPILTEIYNSQMDISEISDKIDTVEFVLIITVVELSLFISQQNRTHKK